MAVPLDQHGEQDLVKLAPYLTTKMGILFEKDCLSLMAKMRSGSIDMVFADPPFNIGKDYKNSFSDNVPQDEYLNWCRKWISECSRLLKPGGSFFIYALPELAAKFTGFMNEQLSFRHWIALSMKGSFPRGRKLYPAHYALLYYSKGDPKTFNRLYTPIPTCRHCHKETKDYGGHRNKLNPKGITLSDFWEDTSPNRHKGSKARMGINELKIVIPERAILMSTNPGDIVYDPFGGGGSTYQAAEAHERFWIGSELACCHIGDRMRKAFPGSGQVSAFEVEALFNSKPEWVCGTNANLDTGLFG